MNRRTHRAFVAGLAAALLGLGAVAALEPAPRDAAVAAQPGPLEALILLRWGYGALDWLIPHDNGDRDERKHRNRA